MSLLSPGEGGGYVEKLFTTLIHEPYRDTGNCSEVSKERYSDDTSIDVIVDRVRENHPSIWLAERAFKQSEIFTCGGISNRIFDNAFEVKHQDLLRYFTQFIA